MDQRIRSDNRDSKIFLLVVALFFLAAACAREKAGLKSLPAELAKSSRTEANGWINVHLEGTPREIGFQHGWHLAAEIDDLLKTLGPLPRGLDEARLGLLPGRGRADVLAQARPGVPGGDRGHRRGPEGPAARASTTTGSTSPSSTAGSSSPGTTSPTWTRRPRRAPATTRPRATAAPSSPRGAGPRTARSSSATTTGSTTSSARAGTSSPTSSRRRASASSWTPCPAPSTAATTSS